MSKGVEKSPVNRIAQQNRQRVCVQGLGFVGAAMATAVACAKGESGEVLFDVVGVELPNKVGRTRAEAINRGEFPFETTDRQLVEFTKKAREFGNLQATTDDSVYDDADVVIVDVALDISFGQSGPRVDFGVFTQAIKTLGRWVQSGTLIIVETTVPPGSCEKVVLPTLRKELVKRKIPENSVLVAHSYERIMPGDKYLESIINYWRAYSGHTLEAANACEDFLSKVINVGKYPLTRLESTQASETAKAMENTYRAVNIAFIEEWTRYAEAIGIDLFEVIDTIRVRPTHSNIRVPGLGVGGYCLTKDPLFGLVSANQLYGMENLSFPFSCLATEINRGMPMHSIHRLTTLLGGALKGKHILICGVGYRQGVADTRFSPSEYVVKTLEKHGSTVIPYDPLVQYWTEMDRYLPKELPDPKEFDAILFAVPHRQFMALNLVSWIGNARPVILDTVNVVDKDKREACRKVGIRIESIGRGDGL